MKFSLELKNLKNQKLAIFSLPQSNHYQQISNLKITSQNYQVIKEKEWGNEIVFFRLNDIEKKSELSFELYSKTYQKQIPKKFSLKNYQNKNLKIIDNRFINGQDSKIKRLTRKVIGQEESLFIIIKKLYNFTLNYLTYGKPTDGLYSYHQALTEKTTDCGGFSTLLGSLLQSLNIPTRLVVGFIVNKNLLKKFLNPLSVIRYTFNDLLIHAWLEFKLPDGSWFPLDPSIDWKRKKGLTKHQGGFGFIPNDRMVTSFGCDFRINIDKINYQIDILQKPVFY